MYQLLFIAEEDGGVGFEIYSFGFADDVQPAGGYVFLIGQTEADYVQHLRYACWVDMWLSLQEGLIECDWNLLLSVKA